MGTQPSSGTTADTNSPSIAAVVFSYNYARYLREAINSLLEQRTPFDQIVVIDDGSTDESPDIIDSYQDRIESVSQENTGQLGAARTALQQVRTDYAYFLDADDYAEPDAREIIARHLDGAPAKVQFQLRCVDNSGHLDSIIPAYPERYGSPQMLVDNRIIGFYISPPTSGNVFSVAALQSLELDRLDGREAFDGTPMLCMPYLGDVRSVARIIANYRLHGANISMQHAPSEQTYQRLLKQHQLRWQELSDLVPGVSAPPAGSTAIEQEANCLILPLSGKPLALKMAVGYVRTLSGSALPRRMKLMLSLFMLTVWLLPAKAASRLIQARRSPRQRNPLMQRVLRRVLGIQSTQRI